MGSGSRLSGWMGVGAVWVLFERVVITLTRNHTTLFMFLLSCLAASRMLLAALSALLRKFEDSTESFPRSRLFKPNSRASCLPPVSFSIFLRTWPAMDELHPQSLLEQPRHPQLTHWISWSSFSCSRGTRQIQVLLKFVSLVWMQRRQQSYYHQAVSSARSPFPQFRKG